MFTGIIEKIGIIKKNIISPQGGKLTIVVDFISEPLYIGESISINGTCLTVIDANQHEFVVELSPETYQKTTFKYKKEGEKVNLERPLSFNERLGGHFVSGHIDSVGQLLERYEIGNSINMKYSIPFEFLRYLIPKGSIAIDGVSLTVAELHEDQVSTTIIPHTLKMTTLGNIKNGDYVNLEFDIMAKYIEGFVRFHENHDKITLELLKTHGFLKEVI